MPSPYTPPDVIVTQVRQTSQAAPAQPQLPVVLIAPCVAIVTRESAGAYSAGIAFSEPLPDLPAGAVVDPDSLTVLLDAQDASGNDLGLFSLNVPNDAQLGTDNASVTVVANLGLSYSLLSARNNQGPGTSQFDDFGSGTPDGIFFTDDTLDFLSLGATAAGDTDIVINAPASMAGIYRIYELIGNGTEVNEVKVQQISDPATGDLVLNKSFNITSGGYPGVNGTAIINGTATDVANNDVGLISPGGTVETTGNADYPASGAFHVPAATSNDQVVMTVTGASNVLAAFALIVNNAIIGDYLRVAGDATSAVNSDYKIVAINKTTPSITIQRLGQTGSGSIASGGSSGSASMKLLRVMRGQVDRTNGAGDYITLTIAGVETDIEIFSASPKQLVLVSTISGLVAATAVTTRRGVPFRNSVASYDLIKRLTTGFGGTVEVSYEAARKDVSLNGLITIGSEDDITANLGVIHPDNPLALMADVCGRSGILDGNHTFYVLAVDDNTLASHQAALERLTSEEVYYMVPGTQETAVLSLYEAHVDAQSLPANKHERILFQTGTLTTVQQVVPPIVGDSWPTDGTISSMTPKTFSSTSIDWTTVSPGDVIKILASADPNAAIVESHRIQTVNVGGQSATTLDAFSSGVQGSAQIFRIDSYPFSKDQQASEWRAEAQAIGDFRVFMMRPDTCQITYTDTTGPSQVDKQIIVPSYYLAAAFAGLCSSLPSQAPMTNVKVPGIDAVFHSNGYFDPDQLNTIAEGGNMIFVQVTKTAAPYAREQLSTDMTSLITRTLSITKNVDAAAKFIRESLRPYIGNKNITTEYLTQLRGIVEALLRGLITSESMLAGSQLVSLAQDPDQPDAIDIVIALNPPYPCNKIYVTIQI